MKYASRKLESSKPYKCNYLYSRNKYFNIYISKKGIYFFMKSINKTNNISINNHINLKFQIEFAYN